jgi:chromosome segregation ATPase
MLIGNKKSQQNNQNWCIILSPVKNEMDRKKVAQKISEVFSLSSEEAMDLVTNTPIILLDNLTQQVAAGVKEYFRPTGAEMILTNDVFLKRKCYRTVWPTEPNLSFLHGASAGESSKREQTAPSGMGEEPLEADDALQEIRSLAEQTLGSEAESAETILEPGGAEAPSEPVISSVESHRMSEELRKLKQECYSLKDERDQLRSQLEELRRREEDESSSVESHMKDLAGEREREIKEIRGLLANAEEKVEILKNEYRQARALYEEKLTQFESRGQEDEKLIQGFRAKISVLESEKKILHDSISEREEQLDGLNRKHQSSGNALTQKLSAFESESAAWKAKLETISRDVSRLEESLEKSEARARRYKEQYEEAQKLIQLHTDQGLETRKVLEDRDREIRELRQRLAKADEKAETLRQEFAKAKAHDDEQIREAQEAAEALADAKETLKEKIAALEDENKVQGEMLEDQKAVAQKLESDFAGQRRQLEGEVASVRGELENWSLRAARLTDEVRTRSKEFEELRKTAEEQSAKAAEAESEYDRTRALLQSKIDRDTQAIEDLERKLAQAAERVESFDSIRQAQEAKLKEQADQAAYWKAQADSISGELQGAKKLAAEEVQAREAAQARQREAEKSQIRLLQDIEDQTRAAKKWEAAAQEAAAKLAHTVPLYERQQTLQAKLSADLEARDKELEALRRQLREIHTQNEQREALQRRNHLAGQLAEKEEGLKRLVKQQEKVESEIREREEAMRAILTDQEKIEKDIIESKQAYRHLMEQAKRERAGKVKVTRANGQAQDETNPLDNPPGPSCDDRTSAQ